VCVCVYLGEGKWDVFDWDGSEVQLPFCFAVLDMVMLELSCSGWHLLHFCGCRRSGSRIQRVLHSC
jgi:hypothetical protein